MARDPSVTSDLWGGLAAMLVALPSSIAFGVAIHAPLGADAAALGAVAGMIGASVLGIVNPLLGGTARLVSAPCAPAAAVMGALAVELAPSRDPAAVLVLLAGVAVLAGLLQILYGALGGGNVIKFIPYPVVSGYLSGVAILIVLKQVPAFFGSPAGAHVSDTLMNPSRWSVPAMVVGVVTILATVAAPMLTRLVPAPIVGLGAGLAAYFAFAAAVAPLRTLEGNRLVIGPVGTGIGSAIEGVARGAGGLSAFESATLLTLVVPSLTLSALLSIDTLKTCVVVDALTLSRHDSNRELRAQGVGNALAAVLGGVPGAGTMGATLVNISSGGRTRLSGMVEGLCCLAALVALGPVVAWIPIAGLAGILFVVAFKMFDKESLMLLRQRSTRLDFAVIAVVVGVAVLVGLIEASIAGFGLAILLFFREQMGASVVRRKVTGDRLSSRKRRLPAQMAFLERQGRRTTIVELQGNLFFGTTDKLFNELTSDLQEQQFVVLDLRRVSGVDYTAARLLDQMARHLKDHGGQLILSGIPSQLPSGRNLRTYLAALDVGSKSGGVEIFDQLDDALAWIEDGLLRDQVGDGRGDSPLTLGDIDLFRELRDDQLLASLADCTRERSVATGERLL
jgi:SulP family sulfate permease